MYELQQSENQMTQKSVKTGSFAIGAIVGAGIALLLAPATGRDVRQRLGHTAKKIGGGAKGVIGKARQTVTGVKEDARFSMEQGRATFEQTRKPGQPSRTMSPTG